MGKLQLQSFPLHWTLGHCDASNFGVSQRGQALKLVPTMYPNKVLEKFLLLIITYQGNIKTAKNNILYIPAKPGNGMDISPLLINYPFDFLAGIFICLN